VKVIIDTSIWSLALRRKASRLNPTEKKIINELMELINDSRVILIGPIRQEILSGINSELQFELLKNKLRAFENLDIKIEDYETASRYFNVCRKNGIQGSQVDYLICAVASNNKFSIFSTDKDFLNYSQHLEISLHNLD